MMAATVSPSNGSLGRCTPGGVQRWSNNSRTCFAPSGRNSWTKPIRRNQLASRSDQSRRGGCEGEPDDWTGRVSAGHISLPHERQYKIVFRYDNVNSDRIE